MTARARVFPDRVDVIITISTHMATVLLTEPNTPAPSLTLESFATLRPRLEALSNTFCTLRSGDGAVLAARMGDVIMTTGEELSFYLAYGAPAPPTLRLEMSVLDRLEPGYIVTLEVLDAARRPLASKPLQRGKQVSKSLWTARPARLRHRQIRKSPAKPGHWRKEKHRAHGEMKRR